MEALAGRQDETTRRFEFSSAGTAYYVTLVLGARAHTLVLVCRELPAQARTVWPCTVPFPSRL